MGLYGAYRLTDTLRIVKAVIVDDRRPFNFKGVYIIVGWR